MKIAAVIVTHNSAGAVGGAVEACLRWAGDLSEGIVVVDNASVDGTKEEATRRGGVRWIGNDDNRGFAGAANQGFREAAGADAVLLLNPDAEIETSPFVLAEAMEKDERVAAVSGRLLGADGRAQRGFQVRRFPTAAALAFEVLGLNRILPWNGVNRRYRALDLDVEQAAEGLQPAGACVLVRRGAWEWAGGFDEGFHPLWFEDVDLMKRLVEGGWKTLYRPEFAARHAGAHSIQQLGWGVRQLYWYGSLCRYTSLHLAAWERGIVCGAVMVGVIPRTVTGMFRERGLEPLRICVKLVRLAMAYLWKGPGKQALAGKSAQGAALRCEPAGRPEGSGQ